MYLTIDVGGTKTLVAVFDQQGQIVKELKLPTNPDYKHFIQDINDSLVQLDQTKFAATAIAIPGQINRASGEGIAFGNLPWHHSQVKTDIIRLVGEPVFVENDAKLAALSEASLVAGQYNRVLYIAVGTGIGVGLVDHGRIDTSTGDGGGDGLLITHEGKQQAWEDFASGSAIVKRYGKQAADITDPQAWQEIASNLAIGIMDFVAVLAPDVVIIGGGVGAHFDKFAAPLSEQMQSLKTDLVNMPPIIGAKRPEEAVVYGCYQLIRQQTS